RTGSDSFMASWPAQKPYSKITSTGQSSGDPDRLLGNFSRRCYAKSCNLLRRSSSSKNLQSLPSVPNRPLILRYVADALLPDLP
ncbi:hypothetical protein GBA52_012457, partial [Prunus armeniaca]